jgi:double zinc ribbon protein
MDQLTQFARRLAERLGDGAGGVYRPVSVTEVRATILPYRAHRKALALDSVEDYETVLLRLAAEERGFVKTVPAAVAERCRKELTQPNPDLGVLDEIGDATLQMTSMAAARIVADQPPPAPEPAPPVAAPAVSEPKPAVAAPRAASPAPPPKPDQTPMRSAEDQAEPEANSCRKCRNPLPRGRQVVFCPWCGERLIPFTCERCGTHLESDWKHCITCGTGVRDPYRFV